MKKKNAEQCNAADQCPLPIVLHTPIVQRLVVLYMWLPVVKSGHRLLIAGVSYLLANA